MDKRKRKRRYARLWYVEFTDGKSSRSIMVGGKTEIEAIGNALHILPKRGRLRWSINSITWERVDLNAPH
jgi:hypothetical protein